MIVEDQGAPKRRPDSRFIRRDRRCLKRSSVRLQPSNVLQLAGIKRELSQRLMAVQIKRQHQRNRKQPTHHG